MAVRLLAAVRLETGVEPALPEWLREPTVAHLARMVDEARAGKIGGTRQAGARIRELASRVRLDDDLIFTREKSGTAVVLTGAAGLIGRRLAANLVETGTREVICLVREGHEARSERTLFDFLARRGLPGSAIRIVGADLAKPRLGLDEARFEDLARGVGSVIHCGAALNLVAGYAALEPANVGGTREALRLAALAGADFHHVSSIGVLPYGAGRRVLESDSMEGDGELLTGYCESKWVAERTVREAMARGLRASISRPGLTLAGGAGEGDDLLGAILRLAREVQALPRLDIPVDLVDADYVAGAIARLAADPRAAGGTYHLTHPEPLPLADCVDRLAAAGFRIPLVDFDEWRERLGSALPRLGDSRIAAIGAFIAAHDADSITPARIDCREAIRLLEGTGPRCPGVMEILAPRLLALTNAPAKEMEVVA
jgi:thioester reductase-like protein